MTDTAHMNEKLKRKVKDPAKIGKVSKRQAQAAIKAAREKRENAPQMPASIRVGFRHYQVIEWDQKDSFSEDRYGDHCMIQARIRISTGIDPEKQANTLLHEIFHACYDQAALQGGEKEEAVVLSLANVLCQVWQDNPDLIAFLDAALGKPE